MHGRLGGGGGGAEAGSAVRGPSLGAVSGR